MKTLNFRPGLLSLVALLSVVLLTSFTTPSSRRFERGPLTVKAVLVGIGGIQLPLPAGQVFNANTGELRPGAVLETVVLMQVQAGDLLQVSAVNIPLTPSVVTPDDIAAGIKVIPVVHL